MAMEDHLEDGPGGNELELIAYQIPGAERVDIVPATRWREWMNAAPGRAPNRCLPLLMANETGWSILNPLAFTATWNGGPARTDLTIEFDEPLGYRPLVESNFGVGIVTWAVPVLFRTPPGYNLIARGPVNMPKDGASALEGVVETDWSMATFTMNWKLTREDHPVRFEAGEPFCTVVPHRRHELESFAPVQRDLSTRPEIAKGLKAFGKGRESLIKRKFIAEFIGPKSEAWNEWEKTYFRGLYPDGQVFADHQTKRGLPGFTDERSEPRSAEGPARGVPEPEPPPDINGALETYAVPGTVRFRSFATGMVVLNLSTGQHFELNPVAGVMLDLLARAHPVGEVAGIVARRFEQPIGTVRGDVEALAAQLCELGILRAETNGTPGS